MHWQQLATVAAGDRDRARMEKKAVADELDKLEREHEVMKSYTEKLKKESEAAAKKAEKLEKEKADFESKTNRIKKSESLAKSKLAQVHSGVRIKPQPSLSDAIDGDALMLGVSRICNGSPLLSPQVQKENDDLMKELTDAKKSLASERLTNKSKHAEDEKACLYSVASGTPMR
jgi:hypothetical protein